MSSTFEVRHVLAAAYREDAPHSMLIHAVEVQDGQDVRVLCSRVKLASIADNGATSPTDQVTCPSCSAALAKRHAVATAPVPVPDEFAPIANPTKTQLYGLQSKDGRVTTRTIAGHRVTITEQLAVRGCFVDGHRRIFSASITAGRMEGLGRATENIGWAPTMDGVVEKATAALAKRGAC